MTARWTASRRRCIAGGVVLLPTDTVYGLAALPGISSATARLFALKGRAAEAPLAVLCADQSQALSLAAVPAARPLGAVASRWWPGPLTVVAQRRAGVELHLGEPSATVGLRVPDHDLVRAIASAVGPIAVTSANHHGRPTCTTVAEAVAVARIGHSAHCGRWRPDRRSVDGRRRHGRRVGGASTRTDRRVSSGRSRGGRAHGPIGWPSVWGRQLDQGRSAMPFRKGELDTTVEDLRHLAFLASMSNADLTKLAKLGCARGRGQGCRAHRSGRRRARVLPCHRGRGRCRDRRRARRHDRAGVDRGGDGARGPPTSHGLCRGRDERCDSYRSTSPPSGSCSTRCPRRAITSTCCSGSAPLRTAPAERAGQLRSKEPSGRRATDLPARSSVTMPFTSRRVGWSPPRRVGRPRGGRRRCRSLERRRGRASPSTPRPRPGRAGPRTARVGAARRSRPAAWRAGTGVAGGSVPYTPNACFVMNPPLPLISPTEPGSPRRTVAIVAIECIT